MSKPAFPQTPDGVTDWDRVFEHPEDGLIAVIASAPNAAALRNCLLVVIRQLYTRKNDELEIAQLTNQIESLFDGADGLPTEAAVGLLRSIKEQRIAKAEAFLERKRAGKSERRSKERGRGVKRGAYLLFKNPKYLAITTALVAVLALGMFIPLELFMGDDASPPAEGAPTTAPAAIPPGESPQAAGQQPGLGQLPPGQSGNVQPGAAQPGMTQPGMTQPGMAQPPAAAPAGEPVQPRAPVVMPLPPFDPKKDGPDAEEYPPVVFFRHVPIPRNFGEQRAVTPMVLPAIVLADRKDIGKICAQSPLIYSMMNVAFSDALAAKSEFKKWDLDRIGRDLGGRLNQELGEPLVTRFLLIRGANRKISAGTKCSFAPNSMLRMLDEFKK